jgi:hypothetical protein
VCVCVHVCVYGLYVGSCACISSVRKFSFCLACVACVAGINGVSRHTATVACHDEVVLLSCMPCI